MARPTNTDGADHSEYRPGSQDDGAASRDTSRNSTGDTLPNTEPQAPSNIPVDRIDDGNIPYQKGGEPHGATGCGSL